MKYNPATLNKLEKVLEESSYVIRYERGTFQSGYCLLEAKKVVVLNKFLNVEGRINILIELIPQLAINIDKLTHESQKVYEDIMKKSLTETEKPE
ncbi:MAG: hypothetical protein H0U39_04880 [Segetibacter sp.]|jgi:hypothetical protein|nr:hypothetical protein [Segetibacter sp.]